MDNLSCTSMLMLISRCGVPMSIDERLDPATGLYTHQIFGLLFNHEIARTHRYPSPLVLLRLTTNQDKTVEDEQKNNDDTCIIHMLTNGLRQVDISSQFGDDYLILLPATDEIGGTAVGKRLLQRFQSEYSDHPKDTGSMLQIGMAAHSGGPTASAETILIQASEALEESRHRGPNTFVNFREIATLGI